jgi:pimeloyl-ACP methyl ester carboxylesterase
MKNTYVLVHGAWADESAWGFVKPILEAAGHTAITVNLPAHGSDNTDAHAVDLATYVEAVKEKINAQTDQIILVGHSMAGMVVSQVAEEMPNKIAKIIYISAYLPQDGDDLLSLSKQDSESLVGVNLEFNADYSATSIKKEVLTEAICADASPEFKEILVKYHQAEPTKPLGEKVNLSPQNFGAVEKWYIHSSQDKAVGYQLQQQMVKANGNIQKIFTLNTSHLPFVVQADKVAEILMNNS